MMPRKSARLNTIERQAHSDDNDAVVGSVSRSPPSSDVGSLKLREKCCGKEPSERELELERDLVVAKQVIARFSR